MTDNFLDSDHLVSLDAIVKALNSEIQWCYQNWNQVGDDYAEAFVRGLEQAKRIIIEMAKVSSNPTVTRYSNKIVIKASNPADFIKGLLGEL